MAAIEPATETARSYWNLNRADPQRAFRAARRHSRIVRILRVALPALIVLVTAGVTISTYLNPLLTPLPANPEKVVVSGSKIIMDHPRLAGFTRDGRAYQIIANSAIQDVTKPNKIELKKINAKVQMQNQGEVELKAPTGIYDSKNNTLKLDRNILISSTNGFRGRLKEASIDIRHHHMVSNKPVEMIMLGGTLKANRMEITDSGDLIRFDDGVVATTRLHESSAPHKKSAANAQTEATSPQREQKSLPTSESDPLQITTLGLPRPDPRLLDTRRPKSETTYLVRLPPADPRQNKLSEAKRSNRPR